MNDVILFCGQQVSFNPGVARTLICALLSDDLYYCAEKQNDASCKYGQVMALMQMHPKERSRPFWFNAIYVGY